MNFSSAVNVSFLFLYLYFAVASVIPNDKTVVYRTSEESEEFDVHVTERGTNFVEKIKINEKNDLEIFHVPSHNEVTEADFLFDFKNNVTVSRVESEASCYLRPLPDKLPKPANLKTGLLTASQTRFTGKTNLIQKYWDISEQVKKTLLSRNVQDFCGQFPVFRLREYHLNSAAGLTNRNTGQTRFARQLIKLPGLCNVSQPFPYCRGPNDSCCNSDNWRYYLKIHGKHCMTYWVGGCKLTWRVDPNCNLWNFDFNTIICYQPVCP